MGALLKTKLLKVHLLKKYQVPLGLDKHSRLCLVWINLFTRLKARSLCWSSVFISIIYYFGPRNHFEFYLTVNWPHQYWYSFKNVNIATLNWRYIFFAKIHRKHSLIRGVFLRKVAVPELKISPIMYFVVQRWVLLCKIL